MFFQSLASIIPGFRSEILASDNSTKQPEQQPSLQGPDELDIACTIRISNSPTRAIEARIRHCNRGFLRIVAPQWVMVDSRIEVLFSGQSVKGQVAYCTAQDQGYAIGVGYGQAECIRREPRIPVDLQARLQMPGNSAPVSVQIIDVSTSGLGLIVPKQLLVGSQVTVEVIDGKIVGDVCYCMPSDGSYRVGFAIESFTPAQNLRADQTSKVVSSNRDPVGQKVLTSAMARFQAKRRESELIGHCN